MFLCDPAGFRAHICQRHIMTSRGRKKTFVSKPKLAGPLVGIVYVNPDAGLGVGEFLLAILGVYVLGYPGTHKPQSDKGYTFHERRKKHCSGRRIAREVVCAGC